jgi:hypothetical protein
VLGKNIAAAVVVVRDDSKDLAMAEKKHLHHLNCSAKLVI